MDVSHINKEGEQEKLVLGDSKVKALYSLKVQLQSEKYWLKMKMFGLRERRKTKELSLDREMD